MTVKTPNLKLVAFFFKGKEQGRRELTENGIQEAIKIASNDKHTDCDLSLVEVVTKGKKEEHICLYNRIAHMNVAAITQAMGRKIESLDDLKKRIKLRKGQDLLG